MSDTPQRWCDHQQTIKGVEVWKDGERTVHWEHLTRDCFGPADHDGPHRYGHFTDATTGCVVQDLGERRSSPDRSKAHE